MSEPADDTHNLCAQAHSKTHLFKCSYTVAHRLAASLFSKPFGLFFLTELFNGDQTFGLHLIQHETRELQYPLSNILRPHRIVLQAQSTFTHARAPILTSRLPDINIAIS